MPKVLLASLLAALVTGSTGAEEPALDAAQERDGASEAAVAAAASAAPGPATPAEAADALGGDLPGEVAANEEPPSAEADLDAVIAEILAGPAAVDEASAAKCVVRSRIRRTEVLSERHVAFHMRGGKKYLIQFERRCMGLHRHGPIRLESRSMQLCAMDTIQGRFAVGFSGSWGPRCLIPGFEPVSAEQLEFIEEALRAGNVR